MGLQPFNEWKKQFKIKKYPYGSFKWHAKRVNVDWKDESVTFYVSADLVEHPTPGLPTGEDVASGFKTKRELIQAMELTHKILEEKLKYSINRGVEK